VKVLSWEDAGIRFKGRGHGFKGELASFVFGCGCWRLHRLVTGLVENNPGHATIPEDKYYGFPLVWRTTDPFVGEKYSYLKLFADCIFWMAVVLAATLLVKKLMES